MEKFTICVIYQAKSEKDRGLFVRELTDSGILDLIRNEAGCLRYEYFNAVEDQKKLVLLEEWENKACQELHMTQPHMKSVMEIKGKYIEKAELKQIKII